jgi:hypothetical protein
MKKIFSMLCIAATLISSCKKDTGTTPDENTGGGGSNNTTVPTTFTQKVLLETFTGAGQPQCTDGFVKQDAIVTNNPTKAIPIAIHFGDAMENNQYTLLASTFSSGMAPQFPSGMINRTPSLSMVIFNRTQWQSNFDVAKNKTATCGLAINTSINGTNADITVASGFNSSLTGTYNLTVYLVENNVTGSGNMYDQRNSYNSTTGHPYAGIGDPIVGFQHKNVVRKILSAGLGDALSSSNIVVGGKEEKSYSTSIAGLNASELYVVAFISKTGTAATDRTIMNVQRVKLGNNQNWD